MLHRLYEVGREPAECTTHHGIVNEMLDKQRLFADHNQPRVILVCFWKIRKTVKLILRLIDLKYQTLFFVSIGNE